MIKEYEFGERKPSGFLVYNDEVAKSMIDSVDDIIKPGEIIVSYHYAADIVTIHVATYYGRKGRCSALKQLIKEIETKNIRPRKNDRKIRKMLGEEEFTTRKALLEFLREELKSIR